MKVKMHRILTVVKNILIAKNLNSQHLLGVNQGFTCRKKTVTVLYGLSIVLGLTALLSPSICLA